MSNEFLFVLGLALVQLTVVVVAVFFSMFCSYPSNRRRLFQYFQHSSSSSSASIPANDHRLPVPRSQSLSQLSDSDKSLHWMENGNLDSPNSSLVMSEDDNDSLRLFSSLRRLPTNQLEYDHNANLEATLQLDMFITSPLTQHSPAIKDHRPHHRIHSV